MAQFYRHSFSHTTLSPDPAHHHPSRHTTTNTNTTTTKTGYVNFSSTHHDWSDGFRLVRQQKYNKANSGDKFGGVYSRLVAVGGLQNREELWPDALQDFMQVHVVVCVC